ncbi:RraA-like protein [Plenodomus tracheiphilus IPT5]|uniref:RraA-like protein n=1 Tax=Plenodomus tracheiphilus IPT5 TaxID=1408161 RepID=A0A6A7BCT0_9PLEO|nr:RraA-like protein [Plenodomus tracheiphilus IPT5]
MASPRWHELYKYAACDLADGLLKLHVPGAGFLANIKPLQQVAGVSNLETKKMLAPASTFLMLPKATKSFPNVAPASGEEVRSNLADARPYADYTEKGTIIVISQPAGQSCAVVGGIMAARMKYLGAEGLVVDGRVRDLVALKATQMPIWSKGTSVIGAGAETKFHARNVPVSIGETLVEAGDIVMIDPEENGVVAVPLGKVEELLELLPNLVGADEKVIADVEQGVSVAEAFRRHRGQV